MMGCTGRGGGAWEKGAGCPWGWGLVGWGFGAGSEREGRGLMGVWL